MITITNISPDKQNPATYQVRINSEIITAFKHRRIDGLAECLRAAARAVDKKTYKLLLDKKDKPE